LLEPVQRLNDPPCGLPLLGPHSAFLAGEDGLDVTAGIAEPPVWLFTASVRVGDHALG
jgi:hypothetical protein